MVLIDFLALPTATFTLEEKSPSGRHKTLGLLDERIEKKQNYANFDNHLSHTFRKKISFFSGKSDFSGLFHNVPTSE